MRKVLSLVLLIFLAGCNYKGDGVTDPPIGIGAEEPSLTVTNHGLLLSWLEPSEGDILLKMALHNGIRWSPASTIAKGEDWFVNWADFPAVIANKDVLFAHFLQKSASSTYAYNVMYTISPNMGETWSKPKKLHQDTVNAEHGFVSAVPYKTGFMVSWLDGRFTGEENGAMTIRGAYIDINGDIHNDTEIDHSTCECCQTSMTLVNGVPWSFYRDRNAEEIRDIYFSKLIGEKWSEPELFHNDNWQIKGCPVNGPMATSYAGNLAVAWFTMADGQEQVRLKISTDAGTSFGEVLLVDSPKSFGRVDIQMDSLKIYVTYLGRSDRDAAIRLKVYDISGQLQSSKIMAMVSPERATGFPRTAIWHENLIITWTDVDLHSIKMLQYPLNSRDVSASASLFAR